MERQTFQSVFDAICDTLPEAANMRLRAEMMQHIEEVIQSNGWTQKQAAEQCGVTQPRVSDLLSGKIDKFSLDALVNINARLGQTASFEFGLTAVC